MGILYKKEIVDGVKSSRKFLGIPLYLREDQNNIITRKYVCGIWKTISSLDEKSYFLFGLRLRTRYYTYKMDSSQYEQIEELKQLTLLKEDEIQNLKKKVASMQNIINKTYTETYNVKTLIQCQKLHQETFGPYKNSMIGKTVVLVASGPSARFHKTIPDAIYIGVNNACLLENVKLEYLFCQDFYMSEEKRMAIVKYRGDDCQKFFGRIPDKRMEHCRKTPTAQHARRAPRYLVDMAKAKEYYVYDFGLSNIAYDIENEPLHPGGIAFSAMQFILHCHPAKIYIVGCDCSAGFFYKSDIEFDNSRMIKIWKDFKVYIDELYPDIDIVSLNPVGLRGIFEDKYDAEFLDEIQL